MAKEKKHSEATFALLAAFIHLPYRRMYLGFRSRGERVLAHVVLCPKCREDVTAQLNTFALGRRALKKR